MPFVGSFQFEWLEDGRNMRLLNDLTYIDSQQNKTIIPKGESTDGASIPSFLWSISGGPFEGKYRRAAVIHDYLCRTQILTWQRTHQIFYEAMIECGVSKFEAWSKYMAVYCFGPRWKEQKESIKNAT